MSDYYEEDWNSDGIEDEASCDYGVCEFCCDPQTKAMGLCTTECCAYMDSLPEKLEPKGEAEHK